MNYSFPQASSIPSQEEQDAMNDNDFESFWDALKDEVYAQAVSDAECDGVDDAYIAAYAARIAA